jgi:cysteine desulfuration protein SufE
VPFPSPLSELVAEFADLPWDLKLEYLAEYADRLPVADHTDTSLTFHPVPECQSPMAYSVQIATDGTVALAFAVSKHAVTATGYLGLLYAGLHGVHRDDLISINDDLPNALGLSRDLSAQRLIGLRAVLARIQLTASLSPPALR